MEIKHRIQLIELLPANPVTCEVGVAEGNFSRDICQQWLPSRHYLVDNWGTMSGTGDGSFPQKWHEKNLKSARDKMKPFEAIAEFLRGPSWQMQQFVKDQTLDFLYLDANHSYVGVMKDLAAWHPKVKKGGVIAFHDYEMPEYGVKEAVNLFSATYRYEIHLIPELKLEDAGAWLRV